MSWSTERRLFLLLVVVAASASSGCYRSGTCGEPETCNYEDDDCDRVIDEDFRDEEGFYVTAEHCGGCGVSCADVFPSAELTECVLGEREEGPFCRIVACPVGWHLAGEGACAADVPVLCLPCDADADCELRAAGSVCVDLGEGASSRCLPGCEAGCEDGFLCLPVDAERSACLPESGSCACDASTLGAEYACSVERADGRLCAGVRLCEVSGLGVCEAALAEACNGDDDDCDGEADEDFRSPSGLYVDPLHCGDCAQPCAPPGPNMLATCVESIGAPGGVLCEQSCEDGFVDVDGILANGCECERFDGTGPPPVVGGDGDCDGVSDDDTDYIFVTTEGSDANAGTLAAPMRTIQAAMLRGQSEGKDVLVARGIYDGTFDIVPGVSIFGGYRLDFADRDLGLYPVVVERTGAPPGFPVLTCANVRTATVIEGFTVQATDAVAAGEGSTALYLDQCGPEVVFRHVTILAGRGVDGRRGDSSSDNLAEIGLGSLTELEGADGGDGRNATSGCRALAGGSGGAKVCPSADAGGGDGGDVDCVPLACTNGLPCGNAGCTDYTVGGVCDFAAVLADAVPNPPAGAGAGASAGAPGELTYDAPTNRGVCNFCDDNPTLPRIGGAGGDGAAGVDGSGGLGCAAGPRVDLFTGRVSGDEGSDGAAGTDGSGGGGGTSGAGYAVIGGTSGSCGDESGGSGGGGGSGGCGAPRAEGGGGGGASVGALLVLPVGLDVGPGFEDVRVVTASGGSGGDGGIAAAGGSGGSGGLGGQNLFWCARLGGRGGDGGGGGAAGGGGGGCGGGSHAFYILSSLGISAAYQATLDATAIDLAGSPGPGGAGGFSPTTPGTPGLPAPPTPTFIQ